MAHTSVSGVVFYGRCWGGHYHDSDGLCPRLNRSLDPYNRRFRRSLRHPDGLRDGVRRKRNFPVPLPVPDQGEILCANSDRDHGGICDQRRRQHCVFGSLGRIVFWLSLREIRRGTENIAASLTLGVVLRAEEFLLSLETPPGRAQVRGLHAQARSRRKV